MLYVGLLSDTHGVFCDAFRPFFDPVDVLWHAGDFGGSLAFAEEIEAFKPLVGVYGNCDGTDYRLRFPEYQLLQCEGLRILMTHIGGSPGTYYPRAKTLLDTHKPDIFICGHSHILKVMQDERRHLLYINPGAAGRQGWQLVQTALRFKIEKGKISDLEIFEIQKNIHKFAAAT
ncbi:MAG: metallophosphoesterase family protein [Bacteroidales bacterium]|nr:metallophosphoesterase family protein [Bacteroidales bacterium]